MMNTNRNFQQRFSQRGVALAFALAVVGALTTLSAGFVASAVTELRSAQYYKNSTKAFWGASSGVNEFMNDPAYLGSASTGSRTINVGPVTVTLSKEDSAAERVVRAVASVGGAQRTIEVTFPVVPADLFSNTMTSGDDFNLTGLFARLDVFGKTRIGGDYNQTSFGATTNFEDRQSGQGTETTTLKLPDDNTNGTADEFADFVQHYTNECNAYPSGQADHIVVAAGDDVIIYPDRSNTGKKMIFVEGPGPGEGDVDIIFDASWRNQENLTIVSTGNVTYVQPLQLSADSKLNIITWEDYNEASILYSAHNGVTYAHDDANFYSVLNYSVTSGNVIANDDINAMEALTWKRFNYANPLDSQGRVPPGFSGLVAHSVVSGYASTPASWKEI